MGGGAAGAPPPRPSARSRRLSRGRRPPARVTGGADGDNMAERRRHRKRVQVPETPPPLYLSLPARWFPLSEPRAASPAAFPPDVVARRRLRAARGARGERPNLGAPGAPQAGAGAGADRFSSGFSSRLLKDVETKRRSSSRSVWGLRGGQRGPSAHQRRPRFIPLGSAPSEVLRLSMTKK